MTDVVLRPPGPDGAGDVALAPAPAGREPFDYESIPAGYYDDVFRRARGVQSKWHHLKFARVLAEVRDCRRVLDIGCGPGTLLAQLHDGHDTVGLDLSRRQIDYASRAHGSPARRFYALTPAELPDAEGLFDAVTLVELIEHLSAADVDATIAGALTRLRAGGKLVVTTPNFASAWPLVEAAVNRVGDVAYDFQHINRFDAPQLAALLDAHGLAEPRVEPYLFVAPFAAAVGWAIADRVARLERRAARRAGMLLLATAAKPA